MSLASAFVPAAVLSALVLTGCPGDDADVPVDASPACLEANDHQDLAWIQEDILSPGCANFSSCHSGAATQAGGLNLEPGRSHDALVGVRSTRFTDWTLVVPGNPAMSYLMVALGSYDGPIEPTIGLMPYRSRMLCKEKRDAIERWIASGAPE